MDALDTAVSETGPSLMDEAITLATAVEPDEEGAVAAVIAARVKAEVAEGLSVLDRIEAETRRIRSLLYAVERSAEHHEASAAHATLAAHLTESLRDPDVMLLMARQGAERRQRAARA